MMKGYITFTYREIDELGEYGLRRKIGRTEKHPCFSKVPIRGVHVYKDPASCIENTEPYYKNFFAEVEVVGQSVKISESEIVTEEIKFLKVFCSVSMLCLCLDSKSNSSIGDFSVKVRLFAVANQFHIDDLLSDQNQSVKLAIIRKGWYAYFINDSDPEVALKAKLEMQHEEGSILRFS